MNERRSVATTSTTPERELWKCRVYGKRGKPKTGFPLFPQPLGNLAKGRRDSHISTAPATKADGKVENQKQVSHFPTARIPFSQNKKTGRGRASPSARRRALRAAQKRVKK
jgi:hypothetical protein